MHEALKFNLFDTNWAHCHWQADIDIQSPMVCIMLGSIRHAGAGSSDDGFRLFSLFRPAAMDLRSGFTHHAGQLHAQTEPADGNDELERRVRRRLGDGSTAAELVARCRERGVTAEVVDSCTCEDLVNELGVSVEAARALFDYDELERRRLSDGGTAAVE
jgi:hypothetical protein